MPQIVGETEAGEPIVEIRAVRLVLQGNAAHFKRMQACSKCGKEIPGAVVLVPGDLERSPQSVICQECVRSGTPYSPPSRAVSVAPRPILATSTDAAPGGAPGTDDSRLDGLERRMSELVSSLQTQRGQWERALGAAIHEQLMNLGAGAEQLAGTQVELQAELASVAGQLAQDAIASTTRLESLEQRLEELRGSVAVSLGQSPGPPAASTQANDDLRRIEEQTNERLDRLAERSGRGGGSESHRLDAIERRIDEAVAEASERADQLVRLEALVHQGLESQAEALALLTESENQRLEAMAADVRAAVGRLTEQLESQGRSLQAAVAEGLAQLQAATGAAPATDASRLQAIEEAVTKRDSELEELHDLHAALDAGMGELRSGIAAGRAADNRTADALDEIYRRLEAMSTTQAAARADQARGWRSGRKSTESTADSGAALVATEELLREQHKLRDQVLSLQRAAEVATTAATRATSQASALGPLRNDVRVLHTQLAEQKAALETLVKTVESLRRKIPGPAPATAKKAPRASKG